MDQPLFSDKPISTVSEDRLERAKYAEGIADFLISDNGHDGLVASINGQWGTGKTSLANMVKSYIIEKAKSSRIIPVLVDFSPWNLIDDTQIISQFFKELSNYFVYDKVINFANKVLKITNLAAQLTIPSRKIKSFFSSLSSAFDAYTKSHNINGENVSEDKEKVENRLSQSRFRYIVFIDDLDRLNDKEIKLVIQLVKAVCGFSNITYVLMIDKDIVAESLKKEQSLINGYQYLKKIIQVEFNVPKIKHQVILNIIEEDLLRFQDSGLCVANRFESALSNGLFNQIETIREEKRFINNFRFVANSLVKEIDFVDLMVVTYIRLIDERAFKLILEYEDFLLGKSNLFYYNEQERRDGLANHKKEFYQKIGETTLANKGEELLKFLFPNQFSIDRNTSDDAFMEGRLYVPQKFHRYTESQADYDDISLERLNAISAFDDLDALVKFSSELSAQEGKRFLQLVNHFTYTNRDEAKAKVILDFLFKNISNLTFEKPLGIINKSLFIRSICQNILKNIDKGEEIITSAASSGSDAFAVTNFYYKLIDKEPDGDITKFSEDNKSKVFENAKKLCIETFNGDPSLIKYGGSLLTLFMTQFCPEELNGMLESKDEAWRIAFLNMNLEIRNSYSTVEGHEYYYSYSIVLDKLLPEDFIDIERLVNEASDSRSKQRLIIYKMQFIDNVQPEDKGIKSYSAKEIQRYCDSKNIIFTASDSYERVEMRYFLTF